MDIAGRRPLLLFPMLAMILDLALMTVCLVLQVSTSSIQQFINRTNSIILFSSIRSLHPPALHFPFLSIFPPFLCLLFHPFFPFLLRGQEWSDIRLLPLENI